MAPLCDNLTLGLIFRPCLLGFCCLLSVGALLWIGIWLLIFFALAVNVTADAWVPALISASCCVHATCALHLPAATPHRILKLPEVLCADAKLAPFCNCNLLPGSLYPLGSPNTFNQLIAALMVFLLVFAHG